MTQRKWRATDPLFRGDASTGPAAPDSTVDLGLVEHILYLGGPGRRTPYTSTTELVGVAEYFAGNDGLVWETTSAVSQKEGASHLPQEQLLQDLRGSGKGRARWSSAWEVAQAANLVRRWSEHIFDWRGVEGREIRSAIGRAFRKKGHPR